MVSSALGPASSPAVDRSIFQIARGAFELGELYIARSRLRTPRWRLHALLAVILAAKDLGLSTQVMESELRPGLDSLLAGRRDDAVKGVGTVVQALLPGWLSKPGACRAEPLQELAASISAPGRLAPLYCARAMLAAGHSWQARRFAAHWPDPAISRRLERLTATALWGHSRDRQFVGQPFDDDFPPGLPRFIAMMKASRPKTPLTQTQWASAEAVLRRLSPADRQTALANSAGAAYHADGFSAGARKVKAVRYVSCRLLAWLRLLVASVEAGRVDDAWRALGQISASTAFHERGRLVLARELVRRRCRRRALRLLGKPFMAPRLEERALLLCEIEPRRLERTWSMWRNSTSRPSEDLALFDSALPSLEHRWTILALRVALERGVPADDRRSVLRTLGIPHSGIHSFAGNRTAVRFWLREIAAGGHDLGSVLRALHWVAPNAVEPIWSEHLSSQAIRLSQVEGPRPQRCHVERHAEAFARGLLGPHGSEEGSAEQITVSHDSRAAISAERGAQDEGTSLSLQATRRRRVILGAVKHCLKVWLVDDVEPQKGALSSRLRTLSNFGGSLAVKHLVRVLKSVRRPNASYRQAFAVLTAMAPDRAADLIFRQHLDLLFKRPCWTREMLLGLEDHGVLEPGFSRRWGQFIAQLQQRLGPSDGAIWLRQLMAAWPETQQTVPTLAALEWCLSEIAEHWPATGDELVRRAERRVKTLMNRPTSQLPATLLEDPVAIKLLLWLRPSLTSRANLGVGQSAWRTGLNTLRNDLGEVDVPMVLRLTRRLAPRQARPLAQRLLAGSHPIADASSIVELPVQPDGDRHRLRYLDKRQDLFTFLRFADCVRCCFSSTSSQYRSCGLGQWVLALWKDPLSFCFHVERPDRGGDWQPCGFVFGGFSLYDDAPVLLLNGIYLRRQESQLRAAILKAIEETFSKPLGILRIAIANRWGGHGQLPVDYVQQPATIFRLRALRSQSGPASAIYDDISRAVNRTLNLDHLFWRSLSATSPRQKISCDS